MKILVIGATGFIGPPLVRDLAARGHEVTILHRGRRQVDLPAAQIIGDREQIAALRPRADVILEKGADHFVSRVLLRRT